MTYKSRMVKSEYIDATNSKEQLKERREGRVYVGMGKDGYSHTENTQ